MLKAPLIFPLSALTLILKAVLQQCLCLNSVGTFNLCVGKWDVETMHVFQLLLFTLDS